MTAQTSPDDILATYNRVARDFQQERERSLFEKPILDRMLGVTPRNVSPRRLLDLGCGTGAPIATYLAERGMAVTGVDGAANMIDIFRETLPAATTHHADMRALDLGSQFDAILTWNTLFSPLPSGPTRDVSNFSRSCRPKGRTNVHDRHIIGRSLGPRRRRTRLSREP